MNRRIFRHERLRIDMGEIAMIDGQNVLLRDGKWHGIGMEAAALLLKAFDEYTAPASETATMSDCETEWPVAHTVRASETAAPWSEWDEQVLRAARTNDLNGLRDLLVSQRAAHGLDGPSPCPLPQGGEGAESEPVPPSATPGAAPSAVNPPAGGAS